MPTETRFETTGESRVPSGEVTRLRLAAVDAGSGHVGESPDGGVAFKAGGWYEVFLAVQWDASVTGGTRFSHTTLPGEPPLISEAIDASLLASVSDGAQLLRGNAMFGPGWGDELLLGVWQDSGTPVLVRNANLRVRELRVPWTP